MMALKPFNSILAPLASTYLHGNILTYAKKAHFKWDCVQIDTSMSANKHFVTKNFASKLRKVFKRLMLYGQKLIS